MMSYYYKDISPDRMKQIIEERFADYEKRLRMGKEDSDHLYLGMCQFFDDLYEAEAIKYYSRVWELQSRLAEVEDQVLESTDWK